MGTVGIDLVDLTDPRCAGKSGDRRFLERILAPGERSWVGAARDPDRALWSAWAAKEAAFKVTTILEGTPPPFRHAAFLVDDPGPDRTSTRVRYGGRVLPVRLRQASGHLVALAWDEGDAPAQGLPDDVRWDQWETDRLRAELGLRGWELEGILADRFTADEARPVHSLPSALARLGARRAVADVLGVEEGRLAIVCPEGPPGRMPPRLHLDGQPRPGITVSLSHHGARVAWAIRTG